MPKSIVTLSAVGVAAGFIVLSGAVLVLRQDVQALQAQLDARNPGASQVTCADLAHVRLRVHGHDARCVTR